ncbi:MAG: nuclear transport factor 2 family protein [Candidatus Thiodiazotropha sp.]|jgi:ketosteroid isomerase-like protein
MNNQQILALEDQLKTAMMNSDTVVLDQLLDNNLIFTNHFGQIMSKNDDLEAHRSGFVKIKSIEQSEYQIKPNENIAIVSVLSHIDGEFGGEESNVALRFTRIWQKNRNDGWQVTAAHSTLVGHA